MGIKGSKGINSVLSSRDVELLFECGEFFALSSATLEHGICKSITTVSLDWLKELLDTARLLVEATKNLLPLIENLLGLIVGDVLLESLIVLIHELIKSALEHSEINFLNYGLGHLDKVVQSVNISGLLISHFPLEGSRIASIVRSLPRKL